jgi:hypothetical protein
MHRRSSAGSAATILTARPPGLSLLGVDLYGRTSLRRLCLFRLYQPNECDDGGYPFIWPKISRLVKLNAEQRGMDCGLQYVKEGDYLTVHHQNERVADCRKENLVPMCWHCHKYQERWHWGKRWPSSPRLTHRSFPQILLYCANPCSPDIVEIPAHGSSHRQNPPSKYRYYRLRCEHGTKLNVWQGGSKNPIYLCNDHAKFLALRQVSPQEQHPELKSA